MAQFEKMQLETSLFFESIEQIYERVFRTLKPRTLVPQITIKFQKYANANSRIRLSGNHLVVDISDLLESAPAPVQEALACILLAKLYRRPLEPGILARYRRYLNRSDIRTTLRIVKRERGRKLFRDPQGKNFHLNDIFDNLNLKYFGGMMARPQLGWSLRPSRTTLGHYDPSHHIIVLSSILEDAPPRVVDFIMFHEMLHLRYPAELRGARRCVHTREFKNAERQFDEYQTAKSELGKFIRAVPAA